LNEVSVNVYEAYDDPRFNRKFDIEYGYRTKTILAVPIKDEKHKVIGI